VNLDKSKSLYTSLNEIGAYDNEADKSFVPHKKIASDVVATQQKFEALKTADVAARNAKNTEETAAFRGKVGQIKANKHNEFSNYYVQYVPEEDTFLSIDKFITDEEYRREQAYKQYVAATYEQDNWNY